MKIVKLIKFVLIAQFLVLSLSVFGSETTISDTIVSEPEFIDDSHNDVPPMVKLRASLSIERVCEEQEPFCMHIMSFLNDIEFLLSYKFSSLSSEIINADILESHYRGVWSTVTEYDLARFIGIISVNKFVHLAPESNMESSSYEVTVEIIDPDGVSAKMKVTVFDMVNLNSVVLEGRPFKFQGHTYIPKFSIAPPRVVFTEPIIISPINSEKSSNDWDVIKGTVE